MADGGRMVAVDVLPGGWVTRKGAARALGLAPRTLREWAAKGVGPACRKVNGRAIYAWADVLAHYAGEADGG